MSDNDAAERQYLAKAFRDAADADQDNSFFSGRDISRAQLADKIERGTEIGNAILEVIRDIARIRGESFETRVQKIVRGPAMDLLKD